MTQQVFADFIGIAPATLSGVFNDRTKPTINIIEAIKRKLPIISTDWLMFGTGQMYLDTPAPSAPTNTEATKVASSIPETLFDFDQMGNVKTPAVNQPASYTSGNRPTRPEVQIDFMKNQDKTPRRVTEIRVFYDDQTWESFIPAKK